MAKQQNVTTLATTGHLSKDQLERQLDELSSLSVDELRDELAKSLRMTADSLVRVALIVRSLESRGEDLSDLRIGILPYLRQIAHGQVLPGVVVRFAEKPQLVAKITQLPLPDQQMLAEGGRVEVAMRREDGTIDHRLVDPLAMSGAQVRQVFGGRWIRSAEEQIAILESRPKPSGPSAAETLLADGIRIDRKKNGLVVGRKFLPAAAVVDALSRLRARETDEVDLDEPDPEGRQITVQVSAAQHERIRQAAHDGRTKIASLVRRALIAYGLI